METRGSLNIAEKQGIILNYATSHKIRLIAVT